MDKKTILVVDDDPKIRTLLRNVFEAEGFCVVESGTADETLAALKKNEPHLVTLDLHLASDNGLEITRDIRAHSKVPIIMVTARSDVIDRVVGLEMGADDYITKPFHVREVVARVRSVLRRADGTEVETAPSDKLEFDGITVCPDHMEVLDRNGEDCGLTSGDFKLLMVFLTHPKRVLSRDQLMDLVGGQEWNPLDRTIDNQVARLRKKIEYAPNDPKLIKTVRGVGYTFASDVHHAVSEKSA
ncbi:MAG: response regulator transcription factor [Silicimonas sp.]|nr:response regulator transcription factor [Silicimonas sp.]